MKSKQKTFYFIGIGGVGMSALARLCVLEGHDVYGYDKVKSTVTTDLTQQGIEITYQETLTALPPPVLNPTTQVIYTAAIPASHEQLNYFIN